MTEESEFWGALARRINVALRSSRDQNIRFLWVDDVIPGTVTPQLEWNTVIAGAFVSEDSGGSFVRYRMTLRLSESAGEAYRRGDWSSVLPPPDSSGWLTISRANKEIEIRCAPFTTIVS